jgi:hypothetical protein
LNLPQDLANRREPAMLGIIRDILTHAKDFIDGLRQPPEFVCGDCERNQRCGLPPHADCIEKAMQRERDPDGAILRAKRRAQITLRSAGSL